MSDNEIVSIDLGGTAFLDTIEFNMPHPDFVGTETPKLTGWILTLAGPAHPKTVEVNLRVAAQENKLANLRDRARVLGKNYKGDERTPEKVRDDSIRNQTDRVVGWAPAPDFKDGKGPRLFSPAACFELFSDRRYARFLNLLITKLADDRNFLPASAND